VIASLTLIDMLVRGIGVGALAVAGLAFLASRAAREVRLVTALASLSVSCWIISESETLKPALGPILRFLIDLPAFSVAGMFWLFAVVVFEDRPLTVLKWIPAILLLAAGLVCLILPEPQQTWLWASRNVFGALLSAHVVWLIARGWSGDLLESRRRLRGVVLGLAGILAVTNVIMGLLSRFQSQHQLQVFMTGGPYGVALTTTVMVAVATLFLQPRPAVVRIARPAAPGTDARAEVAERVMLQNLNALMAADGWRREGLTIGAVAQDLDAPEHRLRRLINQRLGHRNFADFVNTYRIEAAKIRLADPAEARTTVAAIAFDLGYGSLGPFNRAFRAATGSTPTDWRRQALQASPDSNEAG
jgi:AraC-like DNA-binding protein